MKKSAAAGVLLLLIAGLAVWFAASRSTPAGRESRPPAPPASPGAVADEPGAVADEGGARRHVTPAHADVPEPSEVSRQSPTTGGEHRPDTEYLDVTVVNAEGAAAAGATVVLYVNRPRSGYDGWHEATTVTADAAGRAVLDLPHDNEFRVRASFGNFARALGRMSRREGGLRRDVRLELVLGTRFHGRLRDADTLRPIQGARVSVSAGHFSETVTTDRDGRFVTAAVDLGFSPRVIVPDGPSTRVSADGYPYDGASASWGDDRTEILMHRATRITLRMVSVDGSARGGGRGYVKTGDNAYRRPFEPDANGRAACELVVDPGATLEVWPYDGQVVRFPADEIRAQERDLGDVVFRESGIVSGVIVETDGEPVHGAYAILESAAGGLRLDSESTDIDGLFELENAGAGEHVLRVYRRDISDVQMRLLHVLAGTTDLRVVLPEPTGDD